MPSVFETAPAALAIPITFATRATWDAICTELPTQARQFALGNGFAAKPGACLAIDDAPGPTWVGTTLLGGHHPGRDLSRRGDLEVRGSRCRRPSPVSRSCSMVAPPVLVRDGRSVHATRLTPRPWITDRPCALPAAAGVLPGGDLEMAPHV